MPDKFAGREMNLFIRSSSDRARFITLLQMRKKQAHISYARSLKYLGPSNKVCGRAWY